MTSLLAVVLALPLVGAVLVVAGTTDRFGTLVRAVDPVRVAGVTATGWVALAVLAGRSDAAAVTLGRLEVGPLVAVAVAGHALLVAAGPAGSALTGSFALTSSTVFAASASAGDPAAVPDRIFATGTAVLVVLAAIRVRAGWATGGGGRAATVAAVLAHGSGTAVVAALFLGDADVAAPIAVAGTGVLTLAAAARAAHRGPALTPWTSLVPVGLLAAIRLVAVADPGGSLGALGGLGGRGPVTSSPGLAVVGIAVSLVGALVLAAQARWRPATARLPVAVVLASLTLMTVDLADVRRGGVLLAAGAVLAVVAGHPTGLVATLPGLVATVTAAGVASELEHAVAYAAAAVVVGAAAFDTSTVRSTVRPERVRPGWSVAPAVVFGLVPAWGWSGVELAAYTETVAVAGAVALASVTLLSLARTGAALRSGAGDTAAPLAGSRPAGSPAPETPAPETPAPETPAPETPDPETPDPETPEPGTRSPRDGRAPVGRRRAGPVTAPGRRGAGSIPVRRSTAAASTDGTADPET